MSEFFVNACLYPPGFIVQWCQITGQSLPFRFCRPRTSRAQSFFERLGEEFSKAHSLSCRGSFRPAEKVIGEFDRSLHVSIFPYLWFTGKLAYPVAANTRSNTANVGIETAGGPDVVARDVLRRAGLSH